MDCKHLNFAAGTKVGRIHEEGKPEVITSYMLEVCVKCADCGLPFEFVGLPEGMSFTQPMMGAFGFEARMPIVPSTDPAEQVKAMLNTKK